MAEYPIRPAVASDLPMIVRGERDYIREQEPTSEASWTEAIDRNLALWIANLERTIVLDAPTGPAGYAMWMDNNGTAVLVTIRVFAEYRRQGLGRQLLQAYVDDARGHGFGGLELGVHEDNGAKALYESYGFTHVRNDGDYVIYELA